MMDALNTILKTQAMQCGLCRQWTEEWSETRSEEALIEKFKEGLDFCIRHNYPDNAFIKDNFGLCTLREAGVFVDDEWDEDGCKSGTYVVQGQSRVFLGFKDYSVGTIWVRHSSEVSISVRGHAKVFVHVYDEAEVHVEREGLSKVYVYNHSKDSHVTCMGEVMQRENC